MSQAFIVVGLAYGDEGKGSWVDHLVRKHDAHYVVRFNGGVQAHHHVVLDDGRFHGFRQFSAGSFLPKVRTVLSRYMLLEPEMLRKEAKQLELKGCQNPLSRVLVSESTPVITPFARLLNQIQEAYRGGARHGSTGFGIGITQRDLDEHPEQALRVKDLRSKHLFEKLHFLAEVAVEEAQAYRNEESEGLFQRLLFTDLNYYVEIYRELTEQLRIHTDSELAEILFNQNLVFEGAQGVLLDQQFGFFPHVTRSNCTFGNAEQLLREMSYKGEVQRIGLLRAYGTRHGAGPFVTEEPSLEIPPCHNTSNEWQGDFRHGHFDAVTARYALKVVDGMDVLVVTNLDRIQHLAELKIACSYDRVTSKYFLNRATLKVLKGDVRKLSARCKALDSVSPCYKTVQRKGSEKERIEEYLACIETELERKIDAFSDSPLHHKIYR